MYPGFTSYGNEHLNKKEVLTFVVHFPYVHQELKLPQASGLKPAAEKPIINDTHSKLQE